MCFKIIKKWENCNLTLRFEPQTESSIDHYFGINTNADIQFTKINIKWRWLKRTCANSIRDRKIWSRSECINWTKTRTVEKKPDCEIRSDSVKPTEKETCIIETCQDGYATVNWQCVEYLTDCYVANGYGLKSVQNEQYTQCYAKECNLWYQSYDWLKCEKIREQTCWNEEIFVFNKCVDSTISSWTCSIANWIWIKYWNNCILETCEPWYYNFNNQCIKYETWNTDKCKWFEKYNKDTWECRKPAWAWV